MKHGHPSDADIMCSRATYSLSFCSLWQQTLFQIWGSKLNLWPPGQPHSHLALVLLLSSQPWCTGRCAGTPKEEMGRRSPPDSCQSSLYATSHLQEEINTILALVPTSHFKCGFWIVKILQSVHLFKLTFLIVEDWKREHCFQVFQLNLFSISSCCPEIESLLYDALPSSVARRKSRNTQHIGIYHGLPVKYTLY